MLRLSGEDVDSVKGGSFEKIEDGVYLIEAQEADIAIHVKQQDTLHYNRSNGKQGGGS